MKFKNLENEKGRSYTGNNRSISSIVVEGAKTLFHFLSVC